MNTERLKSDFTQKYGRVPRIFRAPGRVNIIGEHTDYNDGFVLPCAIDRAVYLACAVREDRKIRLSSLDFDGDFELDLDALVGKIEKTWVKYVQGVAFALESLGRRLRGADILITSDIPIGAGLSSSAALEIAAGFALVSLSETPVEKWSLVRAGQTAEHDFAGVKTGIMDQFASAFGVENHALFLDCRSLKWSPISLSNAKFVICDTKVKHDLAESQYNARRADCEAAAAFFVRKSLRDISLKKFSENEATLPEKLRKRVRHVLTENERVRQTVNVLQNNDLPEAGKLLNESHESLRKDFEVSCRELDLMIEIARHQKGILGARMIGGGFGGCTINLFENEIPPDFADKVATEYRKITGIIPEIHICTITHGIAEISPFDSDQFPPTYENISHNLILSHG